MVQDVKKILDLNDIFIDSFGELISKQRSIILNMRRNRKYDYDTLIYLSGSHEYAKRILISYLDNFNEEEKEFFADYMSLMTDIIDMLANMVNDIFVIIGASDNLVLTTSRELYLNNTKIINMLKKTVNLIHECEGE